MADVTICIPAYRAAAFIRKTLESVQRQSHSDIVVEIGVEPGTDGTLEICEAVPDPRFRAVGNEKVLGWNGNTNRLLERVRTPYFMFLTHDDVLHPDYVRVLLGALHARPTASVAYSDVYFFQERAGRQWSALESGETTNRLLSFFLEGARAAPWRGVTRRAALEREVLFPVNDYSGFGAEWEWAFELLVRGEALRVPRSLYYKRTYPRKSASLSGQWRLGFSQEVVTAALLDCKNRILSRLRALTVSSDELEALMLACEAAWLNRYFKAVKRAQLPAEWRSQASRVLEQATHLPRAAANRLRAMATLALSRDAMRRGDASETESMAREAALLDDSYADAQGHLGAVLLGAGRLHEALECAVRLAELAPGTPEALNLQRRCDIELNRQYASPR